MPATHVALLRGINVGTAKRVAMADLRAIIEDLGYRDVESLLNSGNVVFRATAAAAKTAAGRIETMLIDRLGIASRVTVLSAAEVATAIDGNPFTPLAPDPSRMLIAVLSNPADRAKIIPLGARDWTPEGFSVGVRVAYLWCVNGILASKLPGLVDRAVGNAVTARNVATMTKIRALLS